MKYCSAKAYVPMAIVFVGCVLFFVVFYFKTKPDFDTNLPIVSENKYHPWLTLRNDIYLNRYPHLSNVNSFFIMKSKIQESSHLLKNEPFFELTTCDFFYLTGHVDFKKNDDKKYYLVRSVKDKYAKGQTQVIVDSSHNLIIRYGFSWGFRPKLEIVDNPIVVSLTHRPNQVFVNLFPFSVD